jgi:predicted nucleic acid-binding protein
MIFWDTSALIRCYEATEVGTHAPLLLHEKGHVGSVLIRIEGVSAVRRRFGRDKAMQTALLKSLNEHLDHFDLSPIDSDVLDTAIALVDRHSLRAGDALQLAGAVMLLRTLGRRQLRFATVDAEQARAARAEGMKVLQLD